ncbi:MAG: anthranilate synthase component I [Alphaproteobacteria bacterium]
MTSVQFQPSLEGFQKHYDNEKTQLVYTWIPADLTTPVSAYLKLCAAQKYAFLLESVEGGSVLGRYSIIGFDPDLIWSCSNESVKLWHDFGSWDLSNKEILPSLEEIIASCKIDVEPDDVPPMAVSGLFGYMGYDMIRQVEKIPDENPDSLGIPESIMIRPNHLVIFDNVKNMMCLVKPVYTHSGTNPKSAEELYREHCADLQKLMNRLQKGLKYFPAQTSLKTPLEISSNTTKNEYCAMVEKAVEYIRAGDIFQVVPSQRFSVPFDLPSFELYRSLRRENPSPFLFHFQFNDFSLVGSSPEILVRVRDEEVTIRPLAGTRKRGQSPQEDKELAQDLLNDPKERAEHLMLLDLGRNDVGRISQIGSVEVTDQFVVEYYSHVMHIVSNVIGKIKPDVQILEALFSGFPAGTVSGAPKIRAMEIIDELEKERRSFYGGCAGYISGNGTMDTCIALRTGLVKNNTLYVQAGAGVVADSKPESEYEETRNKAMALIRAAENALKMHSGNQ